MCNGVGGDSTNNLGASVAKKARVTWQSSFEDQTGKKPDEFGLKTEAEARAYLLAKAQLKEPLGTVLTGYQGNLTTH